MDWRECGCSAELEYHEVVHNSASLSVLGYAVKTLLKQAFSPFSLPFPPFPFLLCTSSSLFFPLPPPSSSIFFHTATSGSEEDLWWVHLSHFTPLHQRRRQGSKGCGVQAQQPSSEHLQRSTGTSTCCTMSFKESSKEPSFLSRCPLSALSITPFSLLSLLFLQFAHPFLLHSVLSPLGPKRSCLITFLSFCYYDFICAIATNYPLLPWPLWQTDWPNLVNILIHWESMALINLYEAVVATNWLIS